METSPSRLLVIEDDRVLQETLTRHLETQGYEVGRATNGAEGLEMTRDLRPDVVLCDWVMPGLDGIGYCREVKSDPELKSTYVTMLSARTDSEDKVLGLDAGADDFLIKPVVVEELLARVRAGLRVRKLQSEIAEMRHRDALVELAATLGHSINNPLTAMFGHLELMLQYLEQGETDKMQYHIRRTGEVAARVAEVAHQLISLREPRTTNYIDQTQMLDLEKV